MGQRFQIIENTEGHIKIYHMQWLWGDYTIRRIGTAVRNFIKYNKTGFRSFEDFLKGSFYGKPNDMNSFYRYFDNASEWDDNKECLKTWKGKKTYFVKRRKLRNVLRTLDNNDGFFYIEFNEKHINGQKGLKGYCFLLKDDSKPITAEQYMSNYERTEGHSKKQEKEYQEGLKTFRNLKLIEPIKIIKTKGF